MTATGNRARQNFRMSHKDGISGPKSVIKVPERVTDPVVGDTFASPLGFAVR
jgi:hypothetical protein